MGTSLLISQIPAQHIQYFCGQASIYENQQLNIVTLKGLLSLFGFSLSVKVRSVTLAKRTSRRNADKLRKTCLNSSCPNSSRHLQGLQAHCPSLDTDSGQTKTNMGGPPNNNWLFSHQNKKNHGFYGSVDLSPYLSLVSLS